VLCALSDFTSLLYDCLTLGDDLSAFLWYMQLERFELKFEIFELHCSHIKVLVCAADADVLG
jgi:hypothetical protein